MRTRRTTAALHEDHVMARSDGDLRAMLADLESDLVERKEAG